MRFQTEIQKKPPAKKRQFSQNVTVFLRGISCFLDVLTKKRQKVRFQTQIQFPIFLPKKVKRLQFQTALQRKQQKKQRQVT